MTLCTVNIKRNNHMSTWQTFCRLWPMISPFKFILLIASVTLIINAIVDISMISLLKPLLDDGFGKADKDIFIWLPIVIICLMILRGITSFISNYCMSLVSGKVVMEMRRRLFKHIMLMPISFFEQQPAGTLLSRITYDSEQVASSSSNTLISIVREGASIIGLSAMMLYHSWQLALIIFFIAPIISCIMILVSCKFRQISKNMQTAMGQITNSVEQMLKGHKEVLIFGGQKIENKHFHYVSNCMRRENMKMVSVSSMFDPLVQFLASLGLAFVLYVASIPRVMDMLTAGSITVIFSSMIVLMKPLKSLTNVNMQFQRGMAACQTLFAILDINIEKDKGNIDVHRVKGNIIFEKVNFVYPGNNYPSLKNVNLSIKSGDTIAVVGRSGSGKSTLINLLARFYDINSGRILLDGININKYKLSSLRNQISLVAQNIYLFNDTIANNIAYACKKYCSRKVIENVACMAYAMDFINHMKNGLDTIIGENGVFLSEGQRQRIAIARALLRNCPILIFDEATSALDSESERLIQKVLRELRRSKTLLIVAHRFSIIEEADEILVFENGCIIERGIHAALISKQGMYAQLYKLQLKR